MGALIQGGHKIGSYLGLVPQEGVTVTPSKGQGTLFSKGHLSFLSGKQEGKELDASEGLTKSTLKLSFGRINPGKYEVFVSVHPAILEAATVSYCSMYPVTGRSEELFVVLRPFKSLDLQSLPWQVAVHVID